MDTKVSNEQQRNKGYALVNAIQHRIAETGIHAKEMAKMFDLSWTYYHLIFNARERWIGSIGEDRLRKIADFLDMELISVYMLAEIIKPDFFYRKSTLDDQVNMVIDRMLNDQRFSIINPKKSLLDKTHNDIRLLIAILYQQVADIDLLKRAGVTEIIRKPSDSK